MEKEAAMTNEQILTEICEAEPHFTRCSWPKPDSRQDKANSRSVWG